MIDETLPQLPPRNRREPGGQSPWVSPLVYVQHPDTHKVHVFEISPLALSDALKHGELFFTALCSDKIKLPLHEAIHKTIPAGELGWFCSRCANYVHNMNRTATN